jgi:hypothetical protein
MQDKPPGHIGARPKLCHTFSSQLRFRHTDIFGDATRTNVVLRGGGQERLARCSLPLCYTCAAMSKKFGSSRIVEFLLCAWVIGAQLWYLLQFKPLLVVLAARFFHKS